MDACPFCDYYATAGPPNGWLYVDDLWGAWGGDVPGQLIVSTRRHVSDGPMGLSDEEARSLGPLLVRIARAMEVATGAERVYVLSLVDRLRHWHYSLTTRTAAVPTEERGLAYLGPTQVAARTDPTEAKALLERVRAALAGVPTPDSRTPG
jgi:hypothetical protein